MSLLKSTPGSRVVTSARHRLFAAVLIASIAALFANRTARADDAATPAAANLSSDSVPIADAHVADTHQFRYTPKPDQTPKHVYVAGDFNNWSTTTDELTRDADGSYAITLHLREGVLYYKFVVDGKWIKDPAAQQDLESDDNYGGKNSAVMIGPDGRHLPPPRPDAINTAAVAFNPTDVRDCNVASASLLRLSLRTQAHDVTSARVMVLLQDQTWQPTAMWKTQTSYGFDRFGTLLNTAGGSVRFYFELTNGNVTTYVAGGRAYHSQAAAQAAAYTVEMTPAFETPEWAKHAVWYQIFPERFRNGDTANDPPHAIRWTSKWFATQPGESGRFYNDVFKRRYGGDIQGIRQSLPYLRKLGVTAIYLNPIFEAQSSHKYDATDYRHIDHNFGATEDPAELSGETDDPATWRWSKSDRIFLDFLADAHRQGFKVILDGVFNHVGRPFWAFQDVVKNGKNSPYAGWFDIYDWSSPSASAPFHYRAWDGNDGSLPAFKKDPVLGIVHGPREHIFAIARRWLAPDGDPSRGVDGFRLDAPENVPHPFWVDFRKVVKETKPDAFIDGEIWHWAQPWLGGDQFDGVMNYRFAVAGQDFFVNQAKAITPTAFNSQCGDIVFNYPFQAALVNQNLFDSHDTDRFASMFVNSDLVYDAANRIQDNGPNYNPAKPNDQQRQRMLQAVAWQMSFVGAPMIYYGDEAGMWGPDDPSDRQPMVWKDLQPYDEPQVQFDQAKFDWYQRLIAVRRQLPALQVGFFRPVLVDDAKNLYAFARDLGEQHVYVILNRSPNQQTVDLTIADHDATCTDWLDPAACTLSFDSGASAAPPRPTIQPNTAAPAAASFAPRGRLQRSLPPWGAAVVTTHP